MDYSLILDNLWVFVILAIWDLIWKSIALWKSAQNNQKAFFIALLLINSVGLLPILYLKFFQKKI